MGIVITSHTNSFTIDLGGLSADRKKARISYADIRSLAADTDDATVEVIFSSGEIYKFPFQAITSIDGDTDFDTQDKLYNKLEAIIFGA